MSTENEEFVLGEDVTALAGPKSRGGTAVLSIRLPLEEVSEIESISRATGKTVSHVIREAIKTWLHFTAYTQPTVTISFKEGSTTSTGTLGQRGEAVVVEPGVGELVKTI